jgi:hypothetical protein
MKSNPNAGMVRIVPLVAISVLAVLLALPGTTYAQRMTGELSGTVVDESGAVIPGADVTAKNEASGAIRRSVTNSDGFFAFAALPAAKYAVTVSIPGFNTYEVTGITLQSGDSRSLRQIALKIATVAETVSVTAEVALTPLNSGEKSATLTGEQIENLPIVGTSAAEVLRLLPGMAPTTAGGTNRPNFTGEVYGINGNGEFQGGGGNNQSAIGNYSSNGTGTGALDITIDGAPGADPGCNCATSVNPNTEFIQEFKVLQSNFGAEHAKGPVNMTVVSKQGGREFHGSIFGSLRDYHLNSNEWYANKIGAPKIKNKFLYPGFSLSGPLLIPGTSFNKNRDKVFFFVGFEYFKQSLDTGFVKSWVPTAEMRNGDFSQAASLGLTGNGVNTVPRGFPGGIIPTSQIDPGGKTLLNVFPNPNQDPAVTGGFNYVDNLLIDQNGWQGLARMDFNISDNTKMFVRYNIQRETQPFVIGLWWRNGQQQVPYPSAIEGKNRSDSGTISLTHVFSPTLTNETIFAVTYINFPNQFTNPEKIDRQALGYPYQGAFGESGGQIPSVMANGGPIYFNPGGFDPILFAEKWQISALENVTKVWGTHTLKAGLYYEHVTNNQPGNGNSNGQITEDRNGATSTGNVLADLLLGRITGSYNEQTQNALHNIAYNIFETYAQDSWKLKPRLTVDFGVRVSYMGPWYGRANFDGKNPGLVAWDQSIYSASAPRSDYPGLTWNAINASIPRSAVSLPVYVTPRVGFAYDVKGTGDTVVRGGFGMYKYHDPQSIFPNSLDFANGVKSLNSNAQSTLLAYEGIGGGSINLTGSALDKNDNQQPTTYSWSASLNQKLPWSMMAEVSYVGNKQTNLLNSSVANLNAVPLYAGLQADPTGGTNPDTLRPLNQYGNLDVYRHNMYANYHALQTLLSRQRGMFNFTAAYTFSKVLGIRTGDPNGSRTGSEYIWDSRSYNYGVMGQDRTHVATASASWLLPEFKGNGVLNAILGNWQIVGIGTYVAGAPIFGNFGIGGTTADGVALNSQHITGSNQIRVEPVLTCDPTENVPSGYLFNPACFAAPTPGNNGNYILPYMKTQAYTNLDLSLFKNFPIGGKGQRLQLRISGYNVLNHAIAFPDSNNNLTLNFVNGVQTNAGFGKLPTDNKYGRRIVQLALRYTF